jgi:SPP1 gp7 family putative phage head morphogenesis protein
MPSLPRLEATQWKAIGKITDSTEKEMAKAYRDVFIKLDKQIADLYAKIGDPPTLAEARRANRLQKLQKTIAAEYKKLTGVVAVSANANTARVYTEALYRTEWAIDQTTGIQIDWPVVPVKAVRAAVVNPVVELSTKTLVQQHAKERIAKINSTLVRSLASGTPYAQTARAIRDDFQGGYADAIRVVRTESNRAMNEGHLSTYGEAEAIGVQMRKRWVATLDDRTRDTHGALDGTYADSEGLFWIGGDSAPAPGMFSLAKNTVNCRCRVVEEIEGLEPELRRIRDEGVVDYITFEDWARPKGWTPEKGWPKGRL